MGKIRKSFPLLLFFVLLFIFYQFFNRSITNQSLSFSARLNQGKESISRFLGSLIYGFDLKQENEELKQRMINFRWDQERIWNLQKENEELRGLVDLKKSVSFQGQAASVIAFDPNHEFQSLWVDKGLQEKIKTGFIVIAQEGLVGRVVKTLDHKSLVLLINDPRSVVDVQSRDSAARGLLVGKRKTLEWDRTYFVTHVEEREKNFFPLLGDALLTSGKDGLFPPGVLVGKVVELHDSPKSSFKDIEVQSQVDLFNLRHVFILEKEN